MEQHFCAGFIARLSNHLSVVLGGSLYTSLPRFAEFRGGFDPVASFAPSSEALVTSSFLLLVVRPGAPSSVLCS